LSRKRRQARFCCSRCRFDWHNERRRRRKRQSPPSAATEAAGTKEEVKATHRITFINRRGTVLAFTAEQIARAANLAAELGARSKILAQLRDERYLGVREVLSLCGICHSRLYQLLDAGRFPPSVLLSPPGRKRRIGWKASDIRRWLKRRQISQLNSPPQTGSKQSIVVAKGPRK
jgi:predicted DNA-binding transcriptional regulator AlpA